MSQYFISYVGGRQPETEEEGKAHMVKYRAWVESLGDAMVSPANPFASTHFVNSDGSVEEGSKLGMSGYTIIRADSTEAALEIAKACPFLEVDGNLEVSELLDMPS